MQYVRAYSNNIFSADTYSERQSSCDRLEDEVVKGINKIVLHTEDGAYTFESMDYDLVRHSFNYIAVKSHRKCLVIKQSEVTKIEFFF